MPKDSPILVRIFKEESELEVWKQDTTGRFALLKVYPICRWSGDLGPKVKEGDRQAPEGFYTITPGLMNPNSNYYLAINTGFPNAFDRANDRHGAFLMIHGDCSSRGCYAMTDEQIGEIYSLARESFLGGQQVVSDPGLSVPHDAGESGAPSQQSEHGLLEDDQGRQRPFRGDASRAEGRRLRPALCVRRRAAAEFLQAARLQSDRRAARPSWSRRRSPDAALEKQRNDEAQYRAAGQRAMSPVAPVDTGTRRRHEQRLPGAGRCQHSAGAGAAARTGPRRPTIPAQTAGRERLPRQPVRRRSPPPRRRASPRPIRNRKSSTSAASSAGCSHRTAPTRSRRPRRRPEAPPRRKPAAVRPKPKSEVAKSEERKPEPQQANAAKPDRAAAAARSKRLCASPGQERQSAAGCAAAWCPPAISTAAGADCSNQESAVRNSGRSDVGSAPRPLLITDY